MHHLASHLPFPFSSLCLPTRFLLRLILKSRNLKKASLLKICFSRCVLLLMLILLAPFLLWQRMQWRSIQGTFPNSEILQAVHSGNIYKSVPRYVYTGCIYPNVNIQICLLSFQFANWLNVYICVSMVNLFFCGQNDSRFPRGENRRFLILMFPTAYLESSSIHMLDVDKERTGSSTRSALLTSAWCLVVYLKWWAAAGLRCWLGYWAFFISEWDCFLSFW